MKKRYLKTIEDIEALRNTDTKIYVENHGGYYKFINGVLYYLHSDGKDFQFQAGLWLDQKPYIEVEDEPSEEDIGKLGWFLDEYREKEKFIDVLASIDKDVTFKYKGKADGRYYQFFRPLTPEEVEKYTGYKVVKETEYAR